MSGDAWLHNKMPKVKLMTVADIVERLRHFEPERVVEFVLPEDNPDGIALPIRYMNISEKPTGEYVVELVFP